MESGTICDKAARLVRLAAARHMSDCMNNTAKPPPRIRISELSAVVDASRLLHWLAHVGRMEGLTRIESAFLLHFAGQLAASGTGSMSLSLEAIAHAIHSEPLPVRRAIDGLVQHGVLGFTPGYGASPSTFHMALPRSIATAGRTVVDDDVPPF
jgi:hypothetical protein